MMTSDFTADPSMTWQSTSNTQIELTATQIEAAIAYSNQTITSDQTATDSAPDRWQIYLDYLAYLGLQQWFHDRGLEDCQLIEPLTIGLPLRLQVGLFQLSILAIGGLIENILTLPPALIEQPELASHFYVWAQVLEEEQTVAVNGFLTYPQLQESSQAPNQAVSQTDAVLASCTIPIDAITLDPNQLLLHLRCLEEIAIPLPTSLPVNPAIDRLRPALTMPKINVGRWINNQIDQLAQEVGWLLMPSLAVPVMRSVGGNFEAIRSSLQQQGLNIPEYAKGAYRDLPADAASPDMVRLYAVMWLVDPSLPDTSDWILLLVADSPNLSESESPIETLQLAVRDAEQTLFDQVKTRSQNPAILYAQVVGQQDECFWVTVTVNQDHVFAIPPFGFEHDR
jgi:Protein of unknown function (DUF1822)